MNLFYLSTIQTNAVPIFVNNWAGVFPLPDEENYRVHLRKKVHDEESLRFLFHWKFRVAQGSKKEEWLITVLQKIALINEWKQQKAFDPQVILSAFPGLPSEWKLFLLHLLQPEKYPFFSAYTMAAYASVTENDLKSVARKRREKFYLEIFIPFIRQEFYDIPMHKTDQALYAFGKFISEASIKIT
jgi:hypothetical protein